MSCTGCGTVPSRTGTAVHIILFSFIETLFCTLFCDHGLDFRKMSYEIKWEHHHLVSSTSQATTVPDT